MIVLLSIALVAGMFVSLFSALGIMLLIADDRIALPRTDRARLHSARRNAEHSEIRREITQKELQILTLEDQRIASLRKELNS